MELLSGGFANGFGNGGHSDDEAGDGLREPLTR